MRMDKAHWPRCLLWHGWLPVLSGSMVPVLGQLMLLRLFAIWLRLRLGGILLVSWLSGFPQESLLGLRRLLRYQTTPMSGRMVVLFWIRSLVFLLLVLGSLLTSLRITGVGVVGVMLIMFGLMVVFSLAGASAPFRGPCSLFRELKCGVILALQSSGAVHLGVHNGSSFWASA